MARDTNFYYSFLVLPTEKRHAITAVWDFCRAVDDAVDRPSLGQLPADELRRWRSEVAACYSDRLPATPQGVNLKPHVERFRLPRRSFEDLIDGVEMDIVKRRYQTFDELYQYCVRVASAVGLLCIEIFGYNDPVTRDYAVTRRIQRLGAFAAISIDGNRLSAEAPSIDIHLLDILYFRIRWYVDRL